jgi:hypothetical protein
VFKFDGVEKAVFSEVRPIAGADVAEKDVPPILRGLDDNLNLITPPARAIKTTQKEFDKLKETMRKDPQAYVQAVNASQHASGDAKMDQVLVKGVPDPTGHMINNPIELPEKK